MIAKFWDAIFEYGDLLKAEKRLEEHKFLENVDRMLQKVYDDGISCATVVKGKEPSSDLEKFVLSIRDIIVYHDAQDDSYYYDLDGHHFDTPEEVMNYFVDTRAKLQAKAMYKVKKEMLETILMKISNIPEGALIGKHSPKEVVRVPLKEKLTQAFLFDEFINKGKSMRQIAIEVGCSDSTIDKYLFKYGLKTMMKGDKV